jgi:putative endopeptidase
MHLKTLRPATLAAALSLAFAANISFAADAAIGPSAGTPAVSSAGLDRSGMDTSVRVQDDLYEAMNGAWFKKTEIPSDRSGTGTPYVLSNLTNDHIKTIIAGLATKPQAVGTINAKIGDFYTSYMNTDAIDAAGVAPLAPYMAQIAAVKTKADLLLLMGHWEAFVDQPLSVRVGPDARDPTVYSANIDQSGLGLDDRDYYLKKDAHYAKARTAYVEYVRTLLTLDGDKDAAAHAAAVMALETRIAQIQWSQEATRDPVAGYNPMTVKTIAAKAPGVDWKAFFAAADLPDPAFVSIGQPSYTWALAKLIKSEPLQLWKTYLRVRLLDGEAPVLPAAFRDALFQFKLVALQGVKQDLPRWKSAVNALNSSLGEALGQIYVSEYFPPAYKARMVELVDNLMKTYATSIDSLTWMSPATKAAAHEKLSKYGVKIGYPDVWRDYSGLEVKAGDPLGNAIRSATFKYLHRVMRNGKPVDRTEWGLTPQRLNAQYDPHRNEIVFPAAILQPPFFDMKADDAANYGAIGAIIGHEISHGFDDQGSRFDGDGKLRDWWTAEDKKAFQAITAKLVAQFAAYEPLPGAHVNGKLTLGENIADLSGMQIAYKAYELSLGGKPSPVIDGLTGEQRFYLSYAQSSREKVRDERALQLLTLDPHSPSQFRTNGAAINSDGFHQAFGTKPGDAMWKAPEDRIRLW